jgi:hypothetical protein
VGCTQVVAATQAELAIPSHLPEMRI